MCKSLAYQHTCTHLIIFRLSTCRGTYETPSLKTSRAPKPGCSSHPHLTLHSSIPCGFCLHSAFQCQLDEDLARVRSRHSTGEVNGWGMPLLSPEGQSAIAKAEERFESESWDLQRRFPIGRFKGCARLGKGSRVGQMRRGSLLRCEVMAEEVVEREWVSLEEELEDRERQKPVEVGEYEAGVAAASKALSEEAEDVHEGTLLSPVEEEAEEEQERSEAEPACVIPESPLPALLPGATPLPRDDENFAPPPQRRAPEPPELAAPPTKPAGQPPHLRRKGKVASMRRKAKGQGDDFGDEWLKCMRTSLAVV